MLKISFATSRNAKSKTVILTVSNGGKLGKNGSKLNKLLDDVLTRGIKASPSFKGDLGQTLILRAPTKKGISLIVLIGIGKSSGLDLVAYEKIGATAYNAISKDGQGEASFIIDNFKEEIIDIEEGAKHAALGAQLISYNFNKYRVKTKKPSSKLKTIIFIVPNASTIKKEYKEMQAIADGVYLTRDLVFEPANAMDPDDMVDVARDLEKYGAEVEILGQKKMEALGMNSLLCVAKGSEKPAYLAVVKWMGAKNKKERPTVFVGKGVTFDTGGISLKPSSNMGDMKYDMAGAGAVLGAMKTIVLRKAKANIIGIIGLVENMPSGNAVRPGDVVKSASGQTIEVLNTDAEGRLVLADALWYAQKHFNPKTVIDLATLTGAISIALGDKYCGLFSNDDDLSFALSSAGQDVNEPLWRMPMHKDFDKMIDSNIADMKNIGEGRAGSITAAQFLQRFIKKNVAWAHLDIAGMAWTKKGKDVCPKGATAYGVRLLNQFVCDYIES